MLVYKNLIHYSNLLYIYHVSWRERSKNKFGQLFIHLDLDVAWLFFFYMGEKWFIILIFLYFSFIADKKSSLVIVKVW